MRIKSIIAAMILGMTLAAAELPLKIKVNNGGTERIDTPICLTLDGIDLSGPLQLVELSANPPENIPCQLMPGSKSTLCWILAGSSAANAVRTFELSKGSTTDTTTAVTGNRLDRNLVVTRGETRILQYNHQPIPIEDQAEAGKHPNVYQRTGYIHPLWSPAGEELTAVYPPDHIHHMGLWHPWTHTLFEGHRGDYWNLRENSGTMRFVEYKEIISGPVFGGFLARQDHVNQNKGQEKISLNETLCVRVWNCGDPKKEYLMDYVMVQTCATASPFTATAYRYSGFGWRSAAGWNGENSDYLTAEGKSRIGGNGSTTRWCIAWKETNEGTVSLLFMSHPQNQSHPEPIRIWDGKKSSGAFFNFNPTQKADYPMQPGKDYTLRYRVYVCTGKLTPERAERLWCDFGKPPQAVVE